MNPSGDVRRILRPEVVSRLSSIDLVARLVVEGFITGLHRSPYHGFSVEFSEYRPYQSGESVKNIDWRIWGRTDRFFVKQFQEETNLKSYLLLDASASMRYSSSGAAPDASGGGTSKFRYAVCLAAALAYLMLVQRDAVGLATFDDRIRAFLPPRSVFSYLHVLLSEMEKTDNRGETDLSGIFNTLAERIKRRGLIVVFSDLLDDQDSVLASLKHFRHRKHEVIVFHILDPMEKRLDFRTDAEFVDLETGEKLRTDPRQTGGTYRDAVGRFVDRYRRECRSHGIDYVAIDTSQPFDEALFRYLTRRKTIGG
jgi:uncharacterized protein (DUF58 family)